MNKLTKLISIFLAVVMVALLAVGCSANTATPTPAPEITPAATPAVAAPETTETAAQASATGGLLDKVLSSKKLVLGTSADYPPYEFHAVIDGKDSIAGFDIELGKAIAKDLGVELEIVDMSFDGLLGALYTGNIDLVIAGMSPDEERKKSVDFSDIYYQATQSALIRAEDVGAYTSIASLAGKKIGVQLGTIQEDIANEQIKDPTVTALTKIGPLVLELKTKKVDAVIMETIVAEKYAANNPDLVIAPFAVEYEEQGSAIAVTKGNEDFLEAINGTIAKLISDGSIDAFVADANLLADEQMAE